MEVRIGKNDDPTKATPADPAAGMRVRRDELDHGMDATLNVMSAQQRVIIDTGEDILELAKRTRRILDPHKPCFSQKA